ncbi:hypothetical protein D3C80_1089640 [compost metagenome]
MAGLAGCHFHQCPRRVRRDTERRKAGRGGDNLVLAVQNRHMDIGIVKTFDHAPGAFCRVGCGLIGKGRKQDGRLAGLGLDDFRARGDGKAAETRCDANGKRQAVARFGKPRRRGRQLPEGHVLWLRALFQKIIDHRRAEQRRTPAIGPKGIFKVQREQRHGRATSETFTHPFMYCDIDKGILDGGHVETYSGTTGPCGLSASS